MSKVEPIGKPCPGCGATNLVPVPASCRLCGTALVSLSHDISAALNEVNGQLAIAIERLDGGIRRVDMSRVGLGGADAILDLEATRKMLVVIGKCLFKIINEGDDK
jgi:hypothetical protein